MSPQTPALKNRGVVEPFGSYTPFAEPAWYNALASPYYNDSHRALRKYVGTISKNTLSQTQNNGKRTALSRKKKACDSFAQDWDIFHFVVLNFELAKIFGGVSGGLGGSSVIGAPPIVQFGTPEQKQKWLPRILTGEVSLCLGATEPTGGSDLANLKTTAVKDASGKFYIVNGHKKWITGAAKATHMTTAVRTRGPGMGGISVLVIDTKTPGVSMRKIKNSGSNAWNSQWVTLENVQVPVENLIGEENKGFPTLMTNFNRERLLIAVNANSVARVIRAKLATIARYAEAHWAWVEQLAYHVKVNNGAIDDLSVRIALAKVQGGRLLELANREAQQIFGGAGYQRGGLGARVEQISRDLRVIVVGGGSEEILTDLAIRQEAALAKKRASSL